MAITTEEKTKKSQNDSEGRSEESPFSSVPSLHSYLLACVPSTDSQVEPLLHGALSCLPVFSPVAPIP